MAALSDSKKSNRRASSETLCSSNSSCVMQKRKPLHPLATVKSRSSNHPVTQRVLSARLLRFKTLQNQLNDAHYHITQLVNENKLLKNIQKRQDQALSKYEGANAQLPQVLESHQEEIRVLQVKNKNLRKTVKDLTDQLKNKDEEIISLKDQNKHLLSLCKNKNLEERKELQEKVDELNQIIKQNESTISMLNRKLMLESKNCKFKLNSEITKHKKTQKELQKALGQLQDVSSKDEIKLPEGSRKLLNKIDLNKSDFCIKPSTAVTFGNNAFGNSSLTNLSDNGSSESASSLKSPRTNIQDIPSSSTSKSPDEDLLSSSEIQLKEVVNSWQKKTNKIEEDLKKYTEEIMGEAQCSSKLADKHLEDYKNSMKNSEILMKTLRETDMKNEKLSKLNTTGDKMSFYDYTVFNHKSLNDQLMSQLLKEKKYSFEEDLLSEKTSKSLTISEPEVDNEDKRKLLAKMKAIDNGDNIVVTDLKKSKCDLMKELFGS